MSKKVATSWADGTIFRDQQGEFVATIAYSSGAHGRSLNNVISPPFPTFAEAVEWMLDRIPVDRLNGNASINWTENLPRPKGKPAKRR